MKSLIVANWKCNPTTLQEAKRIFGSIKKSLKNVKNAEIVICPPFVYLPILVSSTLARQKASKGGSSVAFGIGGQDCFWGEKGAYTGEVSPLMLKDAGCKYVIIGHSERRRYFQETDETINKKIKVAIRSKITPILCIGETEKEKKEGRTQFILNNQLRLALKGVSGFGLRVSRLSIAYEPIWAIGTGKSCEFNGAESINLLIRKIIAQLYSRSITESLRILYGGSVSSKNAAGYIKEARMDGLLVGGASLNPKEFTGIIKAVI